MSSGAESEEGRVRGAARAKEHPPRLAASAAASFDSGSAAGPSTSSSRPAKRSRVVGQDLPRRFVSPSLKVSRGESEPSRQEERTIIRRRRGKALRGGGPAASGGMAEACGVVGSRIGPFELTMPIPDKQLQMLRDLHYEFRDPDRLRGLADMLGEERISLKLYDWFVSRFTHDHRTLREVRLQDGSTAILDVNSAFRSDRWANRKRHWDFFGKRTKVAFDVDGKRHMVSIAQLNAYLFVHRFGVRDLILEVYDALVEHYERGKVAAEEAAIRAAREAAREAGLPEDGPIKRKRGRRRKPRGVPPPIEPIMLSEGTVTTRISLQDAGCISDS